MSYIIKQLGANGHVVVDDKGNHHGLFGSRAEADDKVKELEEKNPVKETPKPEAPKAKVEPEKPKVHKVIHKPIKKGKWK